MAYMTKESQIPIKGKGSRISPKMVMFVNAYMVHFSGPKAVLEAGYKTKNPRLIATELLNHPHVMKEIKERMTERREKSELSAEYVIQKLIAICDATEEDNPQAALRALELLGKNLGLYRDRQEISGPDGRAIEMEQRVKEDVDDFTSRISRLAEQSAEGRVLEFPKSRGAGKT